MSNRPLGRNDSSIDSDLHLELAGHRIQSTNSNIRHPTSHRRPPPPPPAVLDDHPTVTPADLQRQHLDELNQEWHQLSANPVPSNSTNGDSSIHTHLHISATST